MHHFEILFLSGQNFPIIQILNPCFHAFLKSVGHPLFKLGADLWCDRLKLFILIFQLVFSFIEKLSDFINYFHGVIIDLTGLMMILLNQFFGDRAQKKFEKLGIRFIWIGFGVEGIVFAVICWVHLVGEGREMKKIISS